MKDLGIISIADDVVKAIAAKAASEVTGVYKLTGGVVDKFSKILGDKNSSNGIKIEITGGECKIDIYIVVEFGYPVSDVAVAVQKAVYKEVERLTGLNIMEVNVYVQDVKVKGEEKEEKEEN